MNLKPGSRLAPEIEPHGRKFKVTLRLRVGNQGVKDMGASKVVDTYFAALTEIEKWAQEEQAREGLRVTEGLRE